MLCPRTPVVLLINLLLSIALLIVVLSTAAANEAGHSAKQRIQHLPGYWRGLAIETPVGPMNYDMVFHRCGDGLIAGVAKTGASLHYWQFNPEEDPIALRFLSTFRGNRAPVTLLSKGVERVTGEGGEDDAEGVVLALDAPDLELLTLTVAIAAASVDIRIFHYRKPHVHIRLTRADDIPTEVAAHHSRSNSCRGYPLDGG